MQAFTAEKTELLATYGADANRGLTEAQAQKNKEQYGANALTRRKPDTLLKRLWDAATEPMLLMLIAAGLIALAVNIVRQVTGGEADFLECVGVFVAIALSVVISVVMEGRSAKAFEALSKINADMTVRAVRDGQTVTLQSAHLAVGDVVLLSAGDKVPADGRLLESTALRVDESALTGESFPVKKDSELVLTDEKTPLAERANMLYSGTFVTEGNGRLLVTAVGDATEFGKIAGELGNAEKSSTPLQEKLARLGKTITVLGVIAAGIVFAAQLISFAHKELAEMEDFSAKEAHRRMESDMVFDGFVAIADPLRSDVYDAVAACRSAGVGVKILTGDNIVTATAIAKELDLLADGCVALEAKEVEEMSDRQLQKMLPKISVIARSTPTVKMRVVKLLKARGDVVAVTGDGINDAPALKNADVGIAMGISGTEVSKEASDIVLLDDSFATIVKAVEWGRNIYENFKRFISFQLTVNIASVICVFVSVLMGLPAPFTALQLLWINIIMDGPPALTLGLEPGYSDLMRRRPTNRSENIISKGMLARITATGVYMSVVFLLQYKLNFLGAARGEMTTVLFTLFVLFQLFNAFNCRELHSESIFCHLFKNKLMLLIVGCTFVLQVLIIQFAGAFFGTVPLGIAMWGKLFALAFSVIVLSEVIKVFARLLRFVKENA